VGNRDLTEGGQLVWAISNLALTFWAGKGSCAI
jgi:hypothetical protein